MLSLIFRFRSVSLPPGFVSLLLPSTLHFHWHLHSAHLCHLSEIGILVLSSATHRSFLPGVVINTNTIGWYELVFTSFLI
ncbi:hypothetical protein ARMGADRAFT_484124 [Armillaria gallica]|uniref:Uncharacterized protein n=1 Tax=Armillaria gallica TaxID=47427 RepID=A0A2H3E711_ARMGA|nr:hypothetical protein ARMGADRAFT_484124 [Armillaria gallica]